jgi:hypothetical protein
MALTKSHPRLVATNSKKALLNESIKKHILMSEATACTKGEITEWMEEFMKQRAHTLSTELEAVEDGEDEIDEEEEEDEEILTPRRKEKKLKAKAAKKTKKRKTKKDDQQQQHTIVVSASDDSGQPQLPAGEKKSPREPKASKKDRGNKDDSTGELLSSGLYVGEGDSDESESAVASGSSSSSFSSTLAKTKGTMIRGILRGGRALRAKRTRSQVGSEDDDEDDDENGDVDDVDEEAEKPEHADGESTKEYAEQEEMLSRGVTVRRQRRQGRVRMGSSPPVPATQASPSFLAVDAAHGTPTQTSAAGVTSPNLSAKRRTITPGTPKKKSAEKVATLWTRTKAKTEGEVTRKAFLNTIHHMKAGDTGRRQPPSADPIASSSSPAPLAVGARGAAAQAQAKSERSQMEDLKDMHKRLEDEVEALTKALLE